MRLSFFILVLHKTAQPWQLPKKAFPLTSQTRTSITTANRYLPLQENESAWLNQDVSPIDRPIINTPPIDQPPHTIQSSKERSKRTTTIVCDSLINPIKQLNLQQSTPSSKIYVKSFPGGGGDSLGQNSNTWKTLCQALFTAQPRSLYHSCGEQIIYALAPPTRLQKDL